VTVSARISYRDIKQEIVRRISSRVWLPGAIIPGEETLASEFGVARATVNRALRELAGEGLVERRRKAGTRVALRPAREARYAIPLIRHEIEARGGDYTYRLLSSAIVPPGQLMSARLGLERSARLRHLRALHLSDRRPYLIEDRHLSLDTVPQAEDADFSPVSPNEWLIENAPFTHAEIAFGADAAAPWEAELLELDPGSPLFVEERITWLADRPITHVRLLHPPSFRKIMKV
jgi:GntR family transcriptional regulator, histidine utilization repressor